MSLKHFNLFAWIAILCVGKFPNETLIWESCGFIDSTKLTIFYTICRKTCINLPIPCTSYCHFNCIKCLNMRISCCKLTAESQIHLFGEGVT